MKTVLGSGSAEDLSYPFPCTEVRFFNACFLLSAVAVFSRAKSTVFHQNHPGSFKQEPCICRIQPWLSPNNFFKSCHVAMSLKQLDQDQDKIKFDVRPIIAFFSATTKGKWKAVISRQSAWEEKMKQLDEFGNMKLFCLFSFIPIWRQIIATGSIGQTWTHESARIAAKAFSFIPSFSLLKKPRNQYESTILFIDLTFLVGILFTIHDCSFQLAQIFISTQGTV